MKKQLQNLLKIAAATACLLFPAGAKADDTALFTLGGLSAASNWPATVVFALDTSGSMLFHNCEECYTSGWTNQSAPNGATIRINTNFEKLVGPDIDGDNVRDAYKAPYEEDGLTWRGTQYAPILNTGTYKSCSIWYPDYHRSYSDVGPEPSINQTSLDCGTRGSDGEKEAFDAGVKTFCSKYSSCDEANRCIYSMRTHGYYSPGGSGNPYKNACQCDPSNTGEEESGEGDDSDVPSTLTFWDYDQSAFTTADSSYNMVVNANQQTGISNTKVGYDYGTTYGSSGYYYVYGNSQNSNYYATEYVFNGADGTYDIDVQMYIKPGSGGMGGPGGRGGKGGSNSASGSVTVKVISDTGVRSNGTQSYNVSNSSDKTMSFTNLSIKHGDRIQTTVNYSKNSDNQTAWYKFMVVKSSSNVKVARAPAYKKIYGHHMTLHSGTEYAYTKSQIKASSTTETAVVEITIPKTGSYKLLVGGAGGSMVQSMSVSVNNTSGYVYWGSSEEGVATMKPKNSLKPSSISLTANSTATITFSKIGYVDHVTWVALVPYDWSGSTGSSGATSGEKCDVDASGLVVAGDSTGSGKCTSYSPGGTCAFSVGVAYLGDWMNFNPRRDHQVASALYDLMDELEDDVRIGYASYRDIPSVTTAANSNLHPKYLASSQTKDILPPCTGVVGNTNCTDNNSQTACFTQTYRDYFKSEIVNFVGEYNTGTPTAETMDHVGNFARKTAGGSQAFFCDKCQANAFMIVLTDGEPSGSYDTPSNKYCNSSGLPTSYSINGSQYKDGLAYSNGYCMDEVAYLLHAKDIMNTEDGVQNSLTTYTISFALTDINNPDKCPTILEQTASAGGGSCIPAYDISSLKEALRTIIKDITPRAMTYTAPSVAGVRGSGEDSVVSTTFIPTTEMPFWEAHVYKFILCDETDENQSCSCSDPSNDQEMCIVGKDGTMVTYEDNILQTEPVWDAQLCLSGDYLNKHGSGVLEADPWNKDVTNCYRYANETAENRRKIYTTVPKDTDGRYTQDDYQIEFVSTNATNLSYLKNAFGSEDNDAAARVIKFVRGIDVDDIDHDGDVTEDRSLSTSLDGTGEVVKGWWKLGDIFHSSPVLISGLSDSFNYASYRNRSDLSAGFYGQVKERRAIYLAGANDGMIHAFDAGKYNSKDQLVDDTGAELWAFIPPSHLSKLPNMCRLSGEGCSWDNKMYFVDASPTFRDVYIGDYTDNMASESNKKNWKTVVIGGMREGGNTYYALDVTDTENPQFLWEFPPYTAAARTQAGITEEFGQTWLDLGASPSSIGAIALENNKPKWVTLLGAGYDRKDSKGRGYYIVEPYTGDVLYAAQYKSSGVFKDMKYSFAAPPVFTDPKSVDSSSGVLAFSKIIAMDHGGQIWVQDLFTDTAKPKISGGKLDNISDPTIRFKANKTAVAPGDYQTKPIFFLPVTVKGSNSKLRAVFGTGDRDVLIPAAEGKTWDDYVCNNKGVIYSVVVESGTCGTSACTPDDLAYRKSGPSKAGEGVSDVAKAKSVGWYVELNAGERVVNPPSIMSYRKSNGQNSGIVIVTTFEPTLACDRGDTSVLKSCGNNNGSNGIGRLYMLDVETGEAIYDTQVLDGEVPADPRISTKVGDKVESAILLPGTKENPTPTVQRAVSYDDVIERLFDIEVGRDVHEALHK